ADGSYTEPTDTLAFTVAKVGRPGLALDAAGTFSRFDTTADVNLTGTLAYDLAKLTPKLRELLGGNFAAKGTGTRPVSVTGSLSPPAKPGAKGPPSPFAGLTAEIGVAWDSLHAYGFDAGRGEPRGKLAEGVGRFTPVSAT